MPLSFEQKNDAVTELNQYDNMAAGLALRKCAEFSREALQLHLVLQLPGRNYELR